MNLEAGNSGIRSLLRQVVESTDAFGAMAWDCSSLPFKEMEIYYPDDDGPLKLDISLDKHLELVQSVADSGQPRIAIPAQSAQDELPTNAPVLALLPVNENGHGSFILEAFLRPNQDPESYGQSLSTMAGIYSGQNSPEPTQDEITQPIVGDETVHGERIGEQVGREVNQVEFAEYCDLIHRSIQKKETAARIANETRRLIQCDRVSVLHFAENQSKIVAVSGQQSVNRRSNTIRLLEQLALRATRLREEFVYPNDGEPIATQIETALDAYLKLSVARCICIIPLFEKPEEQIEGATEQPQEPKLIGSLVFEHFTEDLDLGAVMPIVRRSAEHASNAYANSLRHESLWLYPLWRLLGQSKFLTATRRLPITLSILIGIFILVAALIVVPWEFKVVSDGQLVPSEIEYIYAPFDGEVIEVVEGGTVLPMPENPIHGGGPYSVAKLLNLELNERMSRVEGQLREAEKELYRLNRSFEFEQDSGGTARSEGEIQAQINSFKRQLESLKTKSDKLIMNSKIGGTVLTHSTTDRLQNRPFKWGDKLLEVANTDGEWIVELRMPDNRIGHVLKAQDALGKDLKVTCVLATDPSKAFTGRVMKIAQSTEVSQESGQTVIIKVAIDSDTDPSILHTRSQVVGKVHCGRRSLGYVWFHQVGEFLQKNVWFRIW